MAPTNGGKTHIAIRFAQTLPSSDNLDGEAVSVPVMKITMPPAPIEKDIYTKVLGALFASFSHRDSKSKLRSEAEMHMRQVGLKMLFIDELQHINASTSRTQQAIFNAIKYLCVELELPIVVIGTERAHRALFTEPELANRFKTIELPRWQNDKAYRQFLTNFEAMLPLKQASRLSKKSLSTKVHTMSEGLTGEISDLLKEAAEEAVKTGAEKITSELLDDLDWVPPSQRRAQGQEQ